MESEPNMILHALIISESGLCRDHHRRQSSRVINGRTIDRINNRLSMLEEAFGEDLNEEESYKLQRLRRQLRYRQRLDDFRRVLFSFKGIQVTWKIDGGGNHLHAASRWGHVEMCIDLLNEKWPINARNDVGQTPLVLAAREGHVRIVRLLLRGKPGWRGGRAKLLMKDHFGHGCLGYATKGAERQGRKKQRGCAKVVEMLQEEWTRRQVVRRNKKKRQLNMKERRDPEDDVDEEEEISESDSEAESSCYEDLEEEEEEVEEYKE